MELPKPFFVIATQNPVEQEGTFPLPEAQMDRFVAKAGIGYPDEAGELDLLRRRAGRDTRSPTVEAVLDAERIETMKQAPRRSGSKAASSSTWYPSRGRPARTAASRSA